MSTTIKLKKSSVSGNNPDPTNLEYGELALNYADGKLFFKTNTNQLNYFSTGGGGGGSGSAVIVSETAPSNPSEGDLWYDPSILETYIYYIDANSNPYWVSIDTVPATADNSADSAVVSYNKYIFTATANQTDFTLLYNVGYVDVYLNGVKLIENIDFTANNGTTIILSIGATVNDSIEIIAWKNTSISFTWQEKTTNYTALAGDNLFIDCSSGPVTVTLPTTATIGDQVRIIDATGSASTNNITIARNGHNILGTAENLIISTNRAAFGLVYYNLSQGWVLMEK